MAYFSNGTEGIDYQEKYCRLCIHDIDSQCPVIMLHLLWNYEAVNDKVKSLALNTLIPVDGIENKQCKMFHPFTEAESGILTLVSPQQEIEKLQAWNEGKGIKVK